ncbi:MAG: ISL3 family transposase [Rhodospirillaceae bacterium]
MCSECRKTCRRVYDNRWRRSRDLACGDREVYLNFQMRRVKCTSCGVKNEKLAFLSENTKYTLRFAMQIGELSRAMTIKDVARLMRLDWHAVKDLDKIYMREQLRVAGPPKPSTIGVDEISIKKGHSYRIVVSDLDARRAIWFGGEGRTEADMDLFFAFLGMENSQEIKLAVMDMWKAFRNSTQRNAPQATIMFDKFHIVKHLSDALDEVRRSEYKRVTDEDRSFIKGQRYVLLSRRENLTDDRRKNLERLLQANMRLNIAYILREQFEQLWDYASPADSRAFFDAWREQLCGQDLKPYEKFARMVDKHWDGIAVYSQPTHKIPLGFVEGFNNKIRVLQRRAFGLHDEEYLKLKILTSGLPPL